MKIDASRLDIVNPKREQRRCHNRQSWYPFYASFSLRFAEALISSAGLPRGALIVDPWNGTGTSSLAAASLGHLVRGFDLNPVMVIAARAKLLDDAELVAVDNTASRFPAISRLALPVEADPLSSWLSDESVREIRAIENALRHASGAVLGSNGNGGGNGHRLSRMPKTMSFFYVALFRTVRHFLRPFMSSNPTWIRQARGGDERIQFARGSAVDVFACICRRMLSEAPMARMSTQFGRSKVDLASADSLPLRAGSVDWILSSPPYCTRIDYAVATMPELALLGYGGDRFTELRRTLTGTLTVNGAVPRASASWGRTCARFLKKLRDHPSKASETYYLRTHLQYFASIERSLGEIHRVLRSGGQCILVVQDSYYKDVQNDLPRIFTEMAELKGLTGVRQQDFKLSRTMAREPLSNHQF